MPQYPHRARVNPDIAKGNKKFRCLQFVTNERFKKFIRINNMEFPDSMAKTVIRVVTLKAVFLTLFRNVFPI
jgi:hypothetical protein